MKCPDGTLFSRPSCWLTQQPVLVEVKGSSMVPFLVDGDAIEVVRAERPSLRPGDLVVFERAGETVVHRFLKSTQDRFLEKGDGQARGNWAPWPEALGSAVAVWRGGERTDLSQPPWPEQMKELGATHLRAHRVEVISEHLPAPLGRLWLLFAFRLGVLRRRFC